MDKTGSCWPKNLVYALMKFDFDFRVKDPCEGALNRVAAQGSLNVGDLYNYLVELGYPLIADEL